LRYGEPSGAAANATLASRPSAPNASAAALA
jgi:hypothetical protein